MEANKKRISDIRAQQTDDEKQREKRAARERMTAQRDRQSKEEKVLCDN